MKEKFVERKFSAESRAMIETINAILEEYRLQGFRLSLRQLYYQMVSRDYVENNQRSYKNMGNLVSNARQAGLIDWGMIEDRGRETTALPHWDNPGEIIRVAAQQFRTDKWHGQPWHVEVMVEKDALSGVLEPVCQRLDIAITANKGYSSSSTMYEFGKRLNYEYRHEKNLCVIYLGDHDPSGIDMTRDVRERLEMYSAPVGELEVVRIALNWDQIEEWSPPENPAKETDSRYGAYVEEFGESSWELDAVNPSQLASLVEEAVLERRDEGLWQTAILEEMKMKTELAAFAKKYAGGA
jgi:hypothetical protein